MAIEELGTDRRAPRPERDRSRPHGRRPSAATGVRDPEPMGTRARSTPIDPLMQQLATSLGQRPPAPGPDEAADPMFAMMAGLTQMIGPSMLAMALGSMVGQLATRAFGQYDLPIPRPGSHELLIVPATIDAFAARVGARALRGPALGLPSGAHRPRPAERAPRARRAQLAGLAARGRFPARSRRPWPRSSATSSSATPTPCA